MTCNQILKTTIWKTKLKNKIIHKVKIEFSTCQAHCQEFIGSNFCTSHPLSKSISQIFNLLNKHLNIDTSYFVSSQIRLHAPLYFTPKIRIETS